MVVVATQVTLPSNFVAEPVCVVHFAESLSDRFAIASQNRINVVLSAQQLVDCDKDNTGCDGGWPLKAWNYMKEVG